MNSKTYNKNEYLELLKKKKSGQPYNKSHLLV